MMKPETYRVTLKRLGMSHSQAARFGGFSERSSRRFANSENPLPIPRAIAMLFAIITDLDITPQQALRLIGEKDE